MSLLTLEQDRTSQPQKRISVLIASQTINSLYANAHFAYYEKVKELKHHRDQSLVSPQKEFFNFNIFLTMNLRLSAASNVFPKQRKQNKDWFDENDQEILVLLKNKNLNRRELQQRVRKIKNDWFTRKASEAEKYRLENNLKDFYATLRDVYGPSSRNSHPIKSKDGILLTTKTEIKKRWVEHFS